MTQTPSPEQSIADVIVGAHGAAEAFVAMEPDLVLDVARREGVVSLLAHSMRVHSTSRQPHPEWLQELWASEREEIAEAMLRTRETAVILDLLSQAGLRCLVLKGCALAHWLYASPNLRKVVDVDLLFPTRADAEAAAEIISPLGYRRWKNAGDLVSFEFVCRRESPGRSVLDFDMHWSIANTVLFARRFDFDELWARSRPVPALGSGARALAPEDALLHACMHRAVELSNGAGNRLKWLFDLHLLAEQFVEAGWTELRELAVEKGLAGIVASGLRASQARFGTVLSDVFLRDLDDSAEHEPLSAEQLSSWRYLRWSEWRSLSGYFERLRWLWQKALIPAAVLVDQHGNSSTGWMLLISRWLEGCRRLLQFKK